MIRHTWLPAMLACLLMATLTPSAEATSQCWYKGINNVPLLPSYGHPVQGAAGLRTAALALNEMVTPVEQFTVGWGDDYLTACMSGLPIDPADQAAFAEEQCDGRWPLYFYDLTGWTEEAPVDSTPAGMQLPRTLLYQTRAHYTIFAGRHWALDSMVKDNYSPPVTYGWCTAQPTLIGYFNGVANTEYEAEKSLDRLRDEFAASYGSVPLEYHTFYNQTGCDRGRTRFSCLEDLYETFLQRDRELQGELSNRFELFWELLTARLHRDGSVGGTLEQGLRGSPLALFTSWMASSLQWLVNKLEAFSLSFAGSPPTEEDMARHLAELKAYDDQGVGAVLVAHSQGNLFVNALYASFKGERDASKLRIVHVAPASPTLNGPYVLGDTDRVIEVLRDASFGAAPSPNIEIAKSPADPMGHSFVSTYMDVSRPAYRQVRALIVQGLDEL